ncbi:hypothetical protein [Schlesneria paludicola]|uniref:hypothetical protein n=1 Tax=Schlesneria paludicola TaxID=360056 RepID=UPI0002F9EAC0|nr:hypothetical protein [Schlesneria paludicola]
MAAQGDIEIDEEEDDAEQDVYMPTQLEIERACAAIRAGWSKRLEECRRQRHIASLPR